MRAHTHVHIQTHIRTQTHACTHAHIPKCALSLSKVVILYATIALTVHCASITISIATKYH